MRIKFLSWWASLTPQQQMWILGFARAVEAGTTAGIGSIAIGMTWKQSLFVVSTAVWVSVRNYITDRPLPKWDGINRRENELSNKK